MKLLAHLGLVVLCAGLLACGTPGAPRPPSLQLSRPVDDLAATRKGSKVTLTWTPSDENTDGTLIRRAGPTLICRGVNNFPMTTCMQAVAEVNVQPTPVSKGQQQKVNFTDALPADLEQKFPTGYATYALESFNRRGRSAGLSNQVRVPLAPTLPAPTNVKAEVTPEGVSVSAYDNEGTENLPVEFHLFRRAEGNTADTDLGTMLDFVSGRNHYPQFLDRSVEWEKTYSYHITPITTTTMAGAPVQVAGDDSPTITVLVHDIFPPAQPVGLQAVASGVGQKPFIDLTWASNQEADLAGYNVYRREDGEWVKINPELVKAPAFRDTNVEPGHTYFYAVSAVDLRGNEGEKSEEASERIP